MRRSNPAGAWMLSIRTGMSPSLRKPCSTPEGASTNVPGGAATSRSPKSNVISPGEDVEGVVLAVVDVLLEHAAARDLDDPEREARRVDGSRQELHVADSVALARRDDDGLAGRV